MGDPGRHMAAKLASTIPDLPASAKLVVKTLEHEGELTSDELQASTGLPHRTLRKAAEKLNENDVITTRRAPQDRRRKIYALEDDWTESHTPPQ